MDKAMILVVLVYWLTSTAYVIHWHYKNNEMAFGVVLMAILLGPMIALIIKDNKKEIENKEHEQREELRNFLRGPESEERHLRRYMNNFPDFQHIPPPPESNQGNNFNRQSKVKNDFKFFRG